MDFNPESDSIQEKLLTRKSFSAKIASAREGTTEYGGIAQLGERLNGIQEVSGSIPLISTKGTEFTWILVPFFCLFCRLTQPHISKYNLYDFKATLRDRQDVRLITLPL